MQAKEFIDEATKLLKNRRENYERIIGLVESYLETLLSEIRGITINGRIKDASDKGTKTALYRSRKRITLQTPLSK